MTAVVTKFFAYGEEEMAYLSNADPILGAAMARMGKIERGVIPDPFAALVHAIVGQLISAKAVRTIWERMHIRLGEITPKNLAAKSADEIQSCGITMNKAICIASIARKISDGLFDLQQLRELTDDEVVRKLSSLDGIGKWTAEMMLIHALERRDVVSWGDMAIRRGMMKLYGLTELTKKQFDRYRASYAPYGSVASIYLWELSFE
ncbi:DNA-3-methyladenine glycosylase family protein [Cohnella faecalis]|uniref:DNA-3-methyladenine glycosylase II n=1 Tax=Cohnella faecalis TaxID=2315694 RepID=A0A398CNC0_9BACL|nr:DNA-3-methyladenine glycosylase [Cohnella faecalis]RIE03985.1 DNA-3-methyladenine glycosylase 2 family protein [Cohnella faecalis]